MTTQLGANCSGAWRNGDLLDDKCVLSRKGLRHKECGT